jgi:hypothetical protein
VAELNDFGRKKSWPLSSRPGRQYKGKKTHLKVELSQLKIQVQNASYNLLNIIFFTALSTLSYTHTKKKEKKEKKNSAPITIK